MAKRKWTPVYLFFYILFLPDTWQILIGICVASLLVPLIIKPDMGGGAMVMLYIMVAVIGYAISVIPGKWISNAIKRLVLKDKV